METKIKVNCSNCKKEYEVTASYLSTIKKRNKNNYCSIECRCKPIEERFWSKVNKTNNIEDCWEWNAGFRDKEYRYGAIKYKDKTIDAHRLSWMMANNKFDLTSKDFICHKCDNPPCVNPNHLFLGDHSINMKDAYKKGRINPEKNLTDEFRFKSGSIPFNSVLSNIQVLEIKQLILNSEKIGEIAKLFGISRYKVSDIKRGRSYINTIT